MSSWRSPRQARRRPRRRREPRSPRSSAVPEQQAQAGDALALGTISERLRKAKTPGVSIAVVDDCKLAWARGYGVRSASDAKPVRPETRFQAASISKTLTAVAALRLVQQGKLALDRPVNAQLRTWTLPAAPGIDVDKVTPRALLSHTAEPRSATSPAMPRERPYQPWTRCWR